ncbi:MAG: hypothetical protein FJ405_01535 [Verrucomicrobia bacterium]|nr:hypothetical protein [Verrucomicrobiota bacterium]
MSDLQSSGSGRVVSYLRALLILGRVSNLPTVWSNCLAGWWLGGAGTWGSLLVLSVGASFVYIGGMFLNDAFDAQHDRLHRSARPIPSGAILESHVWKWGWSWLLIGSIMLVPRGGHALWITLVLLACVLLYDWLHKLISLSPFIMAACRFWLILLAAAFGQLGINGLAIWTGLVLACYVVGLSYLARKEAHSQAVPWWPVIPLAAPMVLGWIVNQGEFREGGLLASLLLLLWIIKCIVPLWTFSPPNIGRAVSGLLAGICLVDFLAATDAPRSLSMAFVGCFALSILLQRKIPAT